MATSNIYQALPLDANAHEIRLITLLQRSGPNDNIIRCRLYKASLDDRPTFTALSYVWGSKETSFSISINNVPIRVGRNLLSALAGVGVRWGEITLWVDAICINQDDLVERARQISMMGRIFSEAQRTIAYISDGAPNEGTYSLCLAILKQDLPPEASLTLARRVHEGMAAPVPERGDNTRAPLNFDAATQLSVARLALEQSQFWWRAWIVQELILARDLVIQCSIVVLPWTLLSEALLQSEFNTYHQVSNVDGVTYVIRVPKKIQGIVRAREAWHNDPTSPRDLLSVLNTYLVNMASDPRDKIWAFLGISDEGNDEDLVQVNLTKSIEEVYTSFARKYINKHKSLRIIQSAGIGLTATWRTTEGDSALRIPSWVPQWYYVDPKNSGERAVLDLTGKLFNASKSRPANVTLAPCGTILRAQGYYVESIADIKAKDTTEKQLPMKQYLSWFIDTYMSISGGSTNYVNGEPLLKVYFRTMLLDQLPNTQSRLGSGSNQFANLLLVFSRALKEVGIFDDLLNTGVDSMGREVLTITRTTDRQKFVILEEDDIDAVLATGGSVASSFNIHNALGTWIMSIEIGTMQNRVLFICSKGYLGMGPPGLLSSDMIYILLGCSVPMVLRKVDDHFLLVGECYVHSLMDGEAMDIVQRDEIPLQDLNIH